MKARRAQKPEPVLDLEEVDGVRLVYADKPNPEAENRIAELLARLLWPEDYR